MKPIQREQWPGSRYLPIITLHSHPYIEVTLRKCTIKKNALLPCIPVLREDGYLLYIHIYFNRFRYTKELCDMKHTRRKSSMWCDTVVWLCLLTFFAPAPFVTTTLPSVVLFCSSLVAFTRLIHVVVRWPFSVFASLTCIVGAHSSEAGANPFLGRYNIATANVTTRTRSKKRNRLKLAIGLKDVVLQLQREKENNKRSRTNTVCFETCLLDLRSANVWHFYALCPRNRSNLLVRMSAWARPLWPVLRGQLQQKFYSA